MWDIVKSLLNKIVPRLAAWIGFDGIIARFIRSSIGSLLCRNEEASADDIEEALRVVTPEQARALKDFEYECCGEKC